MKITLTHKVFNQLEYAKKFIKSWDYHLIASDAYSAGYDQCKKDFNIEGDINSSVEVEMNDGSHQIGEKLTGRKEA